MIIITAADFHHLIENSLPSQKLPSYPSNAIWETVACFTFQSRGLEIIPTNFLVRRWIVTQFNTPKNEMSLKVLLVIGNGFLIPKWKYWIWIWKNENILRTTAWNGVDYSSIRTCVRACHLVLLRKIPTSVLNKCKKMT